MNRTVAKHVTFLFYVHQSGDITCDTSEKPAVTANASIKAFVHYAARRLRLKRERQARRLGCKERGTIQYLQRTLNYMVSPHGSRSTHQNPPAFGYEQLNLESAGPENGEPVLLLHGWGSSADNMRPIAAGLTDWYRVYNLDLPGHGLSPAPPEPLDVPGHATLVCDLIRQMIGGPVTIIGHSNGGRIALYIASDPDLRHHIRRLILISPSGIAPHRSPSYYLKKYTATSLKAPFLILPNSLKEFGLDWLRHSLVWKLLGSTDYRALEGVMRETFVRTVTHHLDERVAKIKAPTLLIWGENDTAVSRRQMQVLENSIPDSGLVVLKGAGHYGYLDDFDTFIAATLHFLKNT